MSLLNACREVIENLEQQVSLLEEENNNLKKENKRIRSSQSEEETDSFNNACNFIRDNAIDAFGKTFLSFTETADILTFFRDNTDVDVDEIISDLSDNWLGMWLGRDVPKNDTSMIDTPMYKETDGKILAMLGVDENIFPIEIIATDVAVNEALAYAPALNEDEWSAYLHVKEDHDGYYIRASDFVVNVDES